MIEEKINAILALAVTAPSGDNSQPWWFHIDGDSLEVNLYPDRDNAILNFRLSGSYIAMGALIENIVLLAPKHSLAADVTLFPERDREHLVARVRFSEASLAIDPLAEVIPQRTTNRKAHHRREIPTSAIEALSRSGDPIAPGHIRIVTDKGRIGGIGEASSLMERVALETPAIHKLFFESLVWSDEEERARGAGLPLATTELPPPIKLLFRAIRHWGIANALNRIGLSRIAAKGNGATYSSSAAIGIVAMKGYSKEIFIEAGRIFQRAWLTATMCGLAFQPVTGLLFLARRIRSGETEAFVPKHLPMIEDAYKNVRDAFSLDDDEDPVMLFRFGYADPPSARTKRRPPEVR